MKISPLEIKKQEFKTSIAGYDKSEVRAFLDLIRAEVEGLIRENAILKDELKEAMRKIEEYREKEKILQETLIAAREMKDEIIDRARKEAEIIVAEAEVKARRVLEDAHRKVAEISAEINELKRQRKEFLTKFKQLIEYYGLLLYEKEEESSRDNISYLGNKEDNG